MKEVCEMNSYASWERKYRKLFGCSSMKGPEAPLVCWCDVCAKLEAAWRDALRVAIVAAVRGVNAKRHPDQVLPGDVSDLRAELDRLRVMEAKLWRVRDWVRFSANSPGGIVAEIDALRAAEVKEGENEQ